MRKKIGKQDEEFEKERNRLLSLIKDQDEVMLANSSNIWNLNNENKALKTQSEDLKREIEVLKTHPVGGNENQYVKEIEITSLKTELELRDKKIKNLELQFEKERKVHEKKIEEMTVN